MKGRPSAAARDRAPGARRRSGRHDRRVIRRQQDGAQVGLRASAVGTGAVRSAMSRASRFRASGLAHTTRGCRSMPAGSAVPGSGPVVIRPFHGVRVGRVSAQKSRMSSWRDADVFEELPRRVLEARGARAAPIGRDALDRPVEGDVGVVPIQGRERDDRGQPGSIRFIGGRLSPSVVGLMLSSRKRRATSSGSTRSLSAAWFIARMSAAEMRCPSRCSATRTCGYRSSTDARATGTAS